MRQDSILQNIDEEEEEKTCPKKKIK